MSPVKVNRLFGAVTDLGLSNVKPGQRSGRMTYAVVVALLVLVGQGGGTTAGVSAAPPDRNVIVVLKDNEDPKVIARQMGLQPEFTYTHVFHGFAAKLPAAAVQGVSHNPHVASISEDGPIELASQTMPVGIRRVGAVRDPATVSYTTDKTSKSPTDVGVAVLDSGIDLKHPDLNVAGGTDCTNTGSYADNYGHGTHVAGTIAAKDNNGGVVGVAPGARLYSVKVLDANNRYSTQSVLICGLDWVMGNTDKVDVVNMSLGGPGSDGPCTASAFHLAICNTVNNARIPVIVAAMNFADDSANYVPAAYNEVITVSAYADFNGKPGGKGKPHCRTRNRDDRFAGFSDYGADVDIAAPGVCVRSTIMGGGSGVMSGTSMATPHVTGAVALYLSNNPGASPDQVRSWLLSDSASQPRDSAYGFTGDRDTFAERVLDMNAATTMTQTAQAGTLTTQSAQQPAGTSDGGGEGGTTADGGSKVTGTATVSVADGERLACRTKPNTDAPIITQLRDGTKVDLLGRPDNRWQTIACGGKNGFVPAANLVQGSGKDAGSGKAPGDKANDGKQTNAQPADGKKGPTGNDRNGDRGNGT
jgi:subtilisin